MEEQADDNHPVHAWLGISIAIMLFSSPYTQFSILQKDMVKKALDQHHGRVKSSKAFATIP